MSRPVHAIPRGVHLQYASCPTCCDIGEDERGVVGFEVRLTDAPYGPYFVAYGDVEPTRERQTEEQAREAIRQHCREKNHKVEVAEAQAATWVAH